MIDFTLKLINSTLETLSEALPILLVTLFYAVTILQLPMGNVIEIFGILGLFTMGLNVILPVED